MKPPLLLICVLQVELLLTDGSVTNNKLAEIAMSLLGEIARLVILNADDNKHKTVSPAAEHAVPFPFRWSVCAFNGVSCRVYKGWL